MSLDYLYYTIIYSNLDEFEIITSSSLSNIMYEGKSISNQPIPFPIDRDIQDFHALFQYMF